MSHAMLILLQLSQDPVLDKVWGALVVGVVGNLIVGVIFIIGFVAVMRKSVDKDIPARLSSIDSHIADLAKELLQMRRELDKHTFQIDSLERSRAEMREDLDDSRPRNRPFPPKR